MKNIKRFVKTKYKSWYKVSFLVMIADVAALNLVYLMALILRFDVRLDMVPTEYYRIWMSTIPIHTAFALISYMVFKLYKSIWHYVSMDEMQRTFAASVMSVIAYSIVTNQMFGRMPASYYLIGWLFEFISITLIRYSYRIARKLKRMRVCRAHSELENIMIIGAGEAGRMLMKEIVNSDYITSRVCCIIDDSPDKQGRMFNGVPVVGGREDILDAAGKYDIDKIIFAIPTAPPVERRDILNICREADCNVMVLPGIYQVVNGEVSMSRLRNISTEELLGRDSVKVNLEEIMGYVSDRVIMVTGGGGSIGSELCRQIAGHKPKRLIIFEIYENNAYDIQQELKMKYPELDLVVLIGSVRDEKKINSVFAKYHPEIIYHAAAHKHVPLMEDSPNEAIKNNVFGTYKTASAAGRYGAKKFVLISTDKAVNPTSVMGATKRICEMIVQDLNKCFDTEYVAVRFGNVLGSNGSVIPLFRKQIKAGGPVTVTHPDIIRYFMTIPEAVSLVLQAGAYAGEYAKNGEIFVLDMGEPVKIDTLARNLIRLSGYTPDVDIKIEYTGLRQGEKLYEELLMSEEGLRKTPNDLIYVGKPVMINHGEFMEKLIKLKKLPDDNADAVREAVSLLVPTYKYKKNEVKKIEMGAKNNLLNSAGNNAVLENEKGKIAAVKTVVL